MVLTESVSLLLVFTLISLVIFWFLMKNRRLYSVENIPPFPVKPWPFVGHILGRQLRKQLREYRQKAGDIYSLHIGGKLTILVNDYKTIKEIWMKHADHIVNTQTTLANEIVNDYDKGIVGARDDNWKEQRAISLSILRSFGVGKNSMAEIIQQEVSYLLEKLSALNGKAEDVKLLVSVSVSNVICSVAIGKRFEYEDPCFIHFIMCQIPIVQYFRDVVGLTRFKFLRYLPGDLFNIKKWSNAVFEINEMFAKRYINEHSKNFNEYEEPQNFITAYIREMKKQQKNGMTSNLNEENLIHIIGNIFVAGSDTISTTILWCLLYMLHNPAVPEKVYHEIEANVGPERAPNMTDRQNLPYLNAVIMETQRMASVLPNGLPREVSSSFNVRGFTIPKGSTLLPILDSVNYDKKIWGDTENFRPERFIDTNGALIKREELIPFCIGKRVCMGEAMARMAVFLFLASIFHRFKYEPADRSGKLPSLKEIAGNTLTPQPFRIKFIERK